MARRARTAFAAPMVGGAGSRGKGQAARLCGKTPVSATGSSQNATASSSAAARASTPRNASTPSGAAAPIAKESGMKIADAERVLKNLGHKDAEFVTKTTIDEIAKRTSGGHPAIVAIRLYPNGLHALHVNHAVIVDGLTPGVRYEFRIRSSNRKTGLAERTFGTVVAFAP